MHGKRFGRYGVVIRASALAMVMGSAVPVFGQWATVEVIPALPDPSPNGDGVFPYAVSADGSTVVGFCTISDYQLMAVRWTSAGGTEALGDLPGGNIQSRAWAVSDDGSVVAGNGWNGTVSRAFRWTRATGLVELPLTPEYGQSASSFAYGVTSDGSEVIGLCGTLGAGSDTKEFRWTATTGSVGQMRFEGRGISADGVWMAGDGTVGGQSRPWRWRVGDPSVAVLPVPAGTTATQVWTISRDGSTVVGQVTVPAANGFTTDWAFRWTSTDGTVNLGSISGSSGTQSWAMGVSGDGSTVVGSSWGTFGGTFGNRAAIWDQQHGWRDLNDLLRTEYGLDLGTWVMNWATAITPDGRTIACEAYASSGPTLSTALLIHLHDGCYANCDGSTAAPVLNANDFGCFMNRFASGSIDANCDGSTSAPVLNANDFQCFLNKFAAGCT